MDQNLPVGDNGYGAAEDWAEYRSLVRHLIDRLGFEQARDVDSMLPAVTRDSSGGVTMTVRDGIADEVIIDLTQISSMELNLREYRSKIIVLAESVATGRVRLESRRRLISRHKKVRPIIYCEDGTAVPVVDFIYSRNQ